MADEHPNGAEGRYAMSLLSGMRGQTRKRTARQPYESKIPNAESLEAIRQVRTGEGLEECDSAEEMIASLNSEESQRARLQQELCSPLLARLKIWRNTAEENRPPDIDWPTKAAFEEADQFVRKLPLSSLPLLDMDIAEDGEINFLWDTDTIEIDLGFYGSRPCSYFARDKRTGRKMRDSGFAPEEGLPDELEALFTQ